MAVSKPAEASRGESNVGAEYLRYASRETSESPPPPPEPAPTPAPDGTDKREEKKGISFEKEDLQMSVNYVPPAQHRNLRACMVCSVVQTSARFQKDGCPNCESFLSLAGNPDAIAECTSQVFEGAITVADPSKSWVARWQRIDGYVPGVYAAKVVGILPEDVIVAIEEAGLRYIPRDGSEMDEAAAEP